MHQMKNIIISLPPDSAETVAKNILEVVISERAEQFVHDWLAKRE